MIGDLLDMRKKEIICTLRTDYLLERGIDKTELADRYEIQRDSVNVWFRGKRLPPFQVLLDLARDLRTNLSYLLMQTEYDFPLASYTPELRLQELRKENKLCIVELAMKSGTAQATIRKYDSGQMERPNLKVITSLSDVLGVSMDYLMGLTDYRTWQEAAIAENPFLLLEAGSAVCLLDPDGGKNYYLVTDGLNLIDACGRIHSQYELRRPGIRLITWRCDA